MQAKEINGQFVWRRTTMHEYVPGLCPHWSYPPPKASVLAENIKVWIGQVPSLQKKRNLALLYLYIFTQDHQSTIAVNCRYSIGTVRAAIQAGFADIYQSLPSFRTLPCSTRHYRFFYSEAGVKVDETILTYAISSSRPPPDSSLMAENARLATSIEALKTENKRLKAKIQLISDFAKGLQ